MTQPFPFAPEPDDFARETGRLLFLRGLIVQEEDRIAAFSGTVRKARKR